MPRARFRLPAQSLRTYLDRPSERRATVRRVASGDDPTSSSADYVKASMPSDRLPAPRLPIQRDRMGNQAATSRDRARPGCPVTLDEFLGLDDPVRRRRSGRPG
jgi:hypothetical protein